MTVRYVTAHVCFAGQTFTIKKVVKMVSIKRQRVLQRFIAVSIMFHGL
jgi:hypothetical protein